MPRRGNVPKRDVLPDPIYGSKVVTKLVNQIMLDGKKGIAQGIVYDAFNKMQEKTGTVFPLETIPVFSYYVMYLICTSIEQFCNW